MSKRFLMLLALGASAFTAQALAVPVTQLVINADGLIATIDVDAANVVTCSGGVGACAGLTIISSTGPHKQLNVIGSIGDFDVNYTGRGRDATVRPTLENLNQLNAKNNTGTGILSATYTDTSYSDLASAFVIAISGVNDLQLAGSTSDFRAYVSAANTIPAATLVGSFLGKTGTSYNQTSTFANPAGSFGSLSEAVTLNFNTAGTKQANFSISNVVVPEPTSVVLFGSVLIASAYALRKKLANRS